MRKIIGLMLVTVIIFCSYALAAENTEAETQFRKKALPELETKGWLLSSYYEYSSIKLAGRKGQWRLLTDTLAYTFNNGLIPYLEIDSWDRFHNKDELINAGAYLKFKDNSYLHSEIGFGDDITYVPRFRSVQEYQRRLVKNLFWQFGYKYLNYSDNDVNIVYPGLYYYFKDHYLSMFYNVSFTESRGTAHWGVLKGNFALNKRLNAWIGTAVGERLYDIELLNASKQYGYIIFSGFDLTLYKELKLRLGFSYSKEKPDFIKRSVDYGLSIKF